MIFFFNSHFFLIINTTVIYLFNYLFIYLLPYGSMYDAVINSDTQHQKVG